MPIANRHLRPPKFQHGLPNNARGLRLAMRGVQSRSADDQVAEGLLEVRSRFCRGAQWVDELLAKLCFPPPVGMHFSKHPFGH